MFTAVAAGTFFLVTGIVGFDVRHTHVLHGGRWAEDPIWSQIMLGGSQLRRAAGVRAPQRDEG